MEDRVSPEVQNDAEAQVKEETLSDDAGMGSVEEKVVQEKEETNEQKPENEVAAPEPAEAKREAATTEQRRPHQQNEDFQKRRMYFRKKVCRLCSQKVTSVDYKDVDLLRRYITDRGKILPRRITGNCARHQRMLAKAIKRARMAALLPFVSK